jgi:hypothetical protein
LSGMGCFRFGIRNHIMRRWDQIVPAADDVLAPIRNEELPLSACERRLQW